MKKYIITIILFTCALGAFAQPQNRERIEALKIGFITEKLDLTKKEAQEFWPIYNEFDKKTAKLRHLEMRRIRREIKDNLNSLSEKRASELLKRINTIELELHKHRLDFAKKIRDVLPAKKLIKLKMVEEDFKRKMFEEFKKRRSFKK